MRPSNGLVSISKGFRLRALMLHTACSVHVILSIVGHRISKGSSCGLQHILMSLPWSSLLLDAILKITPKLVFLRILDPFLQWHQLWIFMLLSDEIRVSLSLEFTLGQIHIQSLWHLLVHSDRYGTFCAVFGSRRPSLTLIANCAEWLLNWLVYHFIGRNRLISLGCWMEIIWMRDIYRINRVLWINEVRCKLALIHEWLLITTSLPSLNGFEHIVKLAWVLIHLLMILFHILNHLIYARLFQVVLP